MNNNIIPQPAYIYYTYVLSYQYELARFIELCTDKNKAIEALSSLANW